ncbi:EipA family protein [Sphingomonas sp. GM_Shp_1]|uniref:EipA family protein n=1 Tax=Sphingomonas sp. GM_Shp_1 TaxID=2937381 RepID=UPI00226B67D0|nr:EipA family protein [Sphingomonas sp. GM_Shp_1]
MRLVCLGLSVLGGLSMVAAAPVAAQVRTIDPNQGIDSDLGTQPSRPAPRSTPAQDDAPAPSAPPVQQQPPVTATPPATTPETRATQTTQAADTFERDDLLAAGEGVFGKGAEGLAGMIERILREQGRPNAYIAGREASGAFVVGLRYGSGIMTHKVEGQMPVYWTGPSLGFDIGGDANKVFVLVYNLYDTEELFHRFPAAEGRLYFVGGFAATYLRRGNVVLIPVRLGVGWRAGVNVGYMNFTHKARWLPF